jgi:hypothetical protein
MDKPTKNRKPGRKGTGYMRVKNFEPGLDPFLTIPLTRPGFLDP